MSRNNDFEAHPVFEKKAEALPKDIRKKLVKSLRMLASDTRHNSLQTHKVEGAGGYFGGDVFVGYVDMKYRLTWEYKGPHLIYLRNVDNHDECLRNP